MYQWYILTVFVITFSIQKFLHINAHFTVTGKLHWIQWYISPFMSLLQYGLILWLIIVQNCVKLTRRFLVIDHFRKSHTIFISSQCILTNMLLWNTSTVQIDNRQCSGRRLLQQYEEGIFIFYAWDICYLPNKYLTITNSL